MTHTPFKERTTAEKRRILGEAAASFGCYTTYSMGQLWNMDAKNLEAAAKQDPIFEAPLDGDALARAARRERQLAEAWSILDAAKIERLRRNHGEIDRSNR